jgi:hypothetical protein
VLVLKRVGVEEIAGHMATHISSSGRCGGGACTDEDDDAVAMPLRMALGALLRSCVEVYTVEVYTRIIITASYWLLILHIGYHQVSYDNSVTPNILVSPSDDSITHFLSQMGRIAPLTSATA